jgi:transcription elongation factor SPT6
VDRYIDPLVTHLKTMCSFRKFKRGSKAEVDEVLRVEKSEYPNRIVYCFGISYEHPGTFILSYIKTTILRHEFVGLHPKGFKFRKQIFGKIEHLVAYFQKHIDDLRHDWGSNDNDWQGQPKSGLDRSTPFPRGKTYFPSFILHIA